MLPIQEAKEKALSWIKADYLDKQNASRTLDDRLADLRQQIVKRVDEELAFLRLSIIESLGVEARCSELKES